MKKKSSVITPPPAIEEEQGTEGNLAISEDERRDALLKLIRKGAPSVPPKETEESAVDERVKLTLRFKKSILERIEAAAADRPLKTPVNTWVSEAILDKLKKEGF